MGLRPRHIIVKATARPVLWRLALPQVLAAILLLVPALAFGQDFIASGSYTGDGDGGRAITGLGFQPDLVIVKNTDNEDAYIRTATMPANASKKMADNKEFEFDRILSLDADGFTVGSTDDTNKNGLQYHWVAMQALPGVLELGSYTGDGLNNRVVGGLTGLPEAVLVMPQDNELCVLRTTDMPMGASYSLKADLALNNGILQQNLGSFTVGTDNAVNKDAKIFHFAAWNTTAGMFQNGWYSGDDADGRELVDVPIDLEYVIIRSSAAERGVQRMASLTGDASLPFDNQVVQTNLIEDMGDHLLRLGNDPAVNASPNSYYILAFGNSTLQADLQLTKTVDEPSPAEGGTVLYTLTVINDGPENTTGVQITDFLPAGLTFISAMPSQGAYDDGTGLWSVGSLDGGTSATMTLTATVDPGTAGTTITNTAEVTASDIQDPVVGNETATAGITVASADLAVTKTVDDPTANEGQEIVFTVTVANNGPSDATGIEITDLLPPGLTFGSAAPGQGAYAEASGQWNVGNLASGGSTTLLLTASVDIGAGLPTITNNAAVSAADPSDPITANDSASAVITVSGADLAVTKTVDDSQPTVGDTVTYTVTVTNDGPADATGIKVTDLLPAGLTFVSATPSTGGYVPASGVWTLGNLTQGASATLVLAATAGAGTGGSTITNTAAVTALNQSDPHAADNSDSVDITVTSADLALTKSVDVASPGPGDTIIYTVAVTNHGPSNASGIQVTDLLPAGVTFDSANPSQGTYAEGTGLWSVGGLADGAGATLSLVATVDAGYGGATIINTAAITSANESDPAAANNSASAGIGVESADLELTKTVDDSGPGEAGTVTYTLTVVNNGPSAASGIQVTDLLPAGVSFGSAFPSQGAFAEGSGVWTVGGLAASAAATLELAVTVDPGTTGRTITNTAMITAAAQTDPNSSDNQASASLTVLGADLQVSLAVDSAEPGEGGTITYTLSVGNGGPASATGVQVTDLLPAGLAFVSAAPGQGSYAPAAGLWSVGALAPTATATLNLTARVNLGTAGDTITDTAVITALDQGDPVGANDSASVALTVQGIDLAVSASVDNATPMGGDTVNYTLTVANTGPIQATGVSLGSALPEGVSLLTSAPSQGSFDSGTGIWTVGTVPGAAAASLVLAARVDAIAASGPLTGQAFISGVDQTDLTAANDLAEVDIVIAGIDLKVTKTVNKTSPHQGETVTYTVTVQNLGAGGATGVRITDILPGAISFAAAAASTGAYDPDSGVWTLGSLAPSASSVLSIQGVVQAGFAGRPVTNFAAVTACDQADAVTGNNSDTAILTPAVDLVPGTVQFWPSGAESARLWPGSAETAPVLAITLTNQSASGDVLQSLVLTNLTQGDGTQAQMDAEWRAVSLHHTRRGDTAAPAAAVTRMFSAGKAAFTGLGWTLAPGDTLDIWFESAPSLAARDEARLRAGLAAPADVGVTQAVSAPGAWPLVDGTMILVDGFVAAQAAVVPVPSTMFPVGSADNLAMTVDLPGNGYLGDTLYGLAVTNRGSALPGGDLAGLTAWADQGDGIFDPVADARLGKLVYSGDLWQLSGLSVGVPASGRRFYITADIAETANPARNIRLSLPVDFGPAVQMFSGNDGPVDLALENPQSQGISVTDRIILTTDWIHSTPVYPGARNLPLLQCVLANTYSTPQRLQWLRVSNASVASQPATIAELDAACRQIVLRIDGNGNGILDGLTVDRELGSGTFIDGVATFPGLDLELGSGSSTRLFVTADLSLTAAADGDRISARIEAGSDVEIPGAVLVAAWPLDSGAAWAVDGMVADQISTNPVAVLTLGPGEGPILALDLTVPADGGRSDELNGINFANHGTAGTGDLAHADLWEDGGNGIFDSGLGDDIGLGPLTLTGSSWWSTVLARPIGPQGLRLFVTLAVAASPQDSVTVQLGVPVGGIIVSSGNDGPIDRAVVESGTLVISTSPLRSSLRFARSFSNVGQTGTVLMSVRNAGSEPVTGVKPELGISSGDGGLTLQAPVPTVFSELAPGQEQVFSWSFTATAAGPVVLAGNAAGLVNGDQIRRSIQTQTAVHTITNAVTRLDLFPTLNLPFSINRGQIGLVPLNLTFMNPGDWQTADAQLTGLKIRLLETGSGPGIVPADLLSRVIVSEGTEIYLDLRELPTAGDVVDLALSRPVRVTSDEPVTLGLRLDLKSASTVPSFLISIEEASWLTANDAVDLGDVPVFLGEGTFPIRTGQTTLVSPASGLTIAVGDQTAGLAVPGQQGVLLARINLTNTSTEANSSTIEMGRLAFVFRDGAGAALSAPGSRLERLFLEGPFQVHFDGPPLVLDDSLVVMPLITPVIVPGNSTLGLNLWADVAPLADLGPIVPVLGGTANIDARDGNMNNQVPVAMTTDPEAPPLVILGPATQVTVGGEGTLPRRISQGTRDLAALTVTLANPHPVGNAPIVCDSLVFSFLDEIRQPVNPAPLLDRIRVTADGQVIGMVIEPAAADGRVPMALGGLRLDPETGCTLVVLLDFKPSAPTGSIEMVITEGGVAARDLVTGLALEAVSEANETLFLSSGTGRVVIPADELQIGSISLMPPLLVPRPDPYPVMSLSLTNPAPAGGGGIAVTALTLTQTDTQPDAPALGALVSSIVIRVGSKALAGSSDLPPEATEATVNLDQVLVVNVAETVEAVVEIVIRPDAPAGALQLALAAAGVTAASLETAGVTFHVLAASGQTFPFLTQIGNVGKAGLQESYANYPNPFAAGREATTFAYFLDRDAQVSLRILTPHGETVTVILRDEPRAAGFHQNEVWEGFNGKGTAVRNGVYLAELVVRFTDGTSERLLRKVAVVR